MDTVINEVAKDFCVSRELLLSKDRSDKVAKARMVLYKVLYMTNKTVNQIGEKLNRNHTSVSVGINKVDKDEELWQKALDIYTGLYDESVRAEDEKRIKRKLLYYELKKAY